MLIVLNPTYTMRVVICDRRPEPQIGGGVGQQYASQANIGIAPHKFFGGLDGSTGCDAALEAVRGALRKAGLDASVTFEKFEHSSR